MTENAQCSCQGDLKLIFACSGASDVGAVSDRAARKMTTDGVGKMYCLAGIGGRVNNIMVNTQAADTMLAIDGCPQDCSKKTLEQAGFKEFKHIRITDLDMEKGKTPVTDENIAKAAAESAKLLSCE
jgi:uncharacterized metal-binding protein